LRNVVAFVLLTGLLVGCGKAPLAGVSVDSTFRPFLLPATKAVVSVELEKIKTTDIYKRHQQEFNLPQLNAMAERTGLDPRRDVGSLLVSWDGSHPLLLARGNFTPENLEKQLRGAGAEHTAYKAYTLLGNPRESIAFPQAGLAVAGAAVPLRGALDSHAEGNGGVPEELRQRLAGIPKSAQIWEASRGGLPFAEIGMRSDLESALSNISGYVSGTSAGITLTAGAKVHADIFCVSNEGAQRVHDALRGVIGLSRLSTNESRLDMLRLWDAIHVDQDQQVIHIRIDLPADLADKLLAELPKLVSRAGGMIK
jgi:hypothetical protein